MFAHCDGEISLVTHEHEQTISSSYELSMVAERPVQHHGNYSATNYTYQVPPTTSSSTSSSSTNYRNYQVHVRPINYQVPCPTSSTSSCNYSCTSSDSSDNYQAVRRGSRVLSISRISNYARWYDVQFSGMQTQAARRVISHFDISDQDWDEVHEGRIRQARIRDAWDEWFGHEEKLEDQEEKESAVDEELKDNDQRNEEPGDGDSGREEENALVVKLRSMEENRKEVEEHAAQHPGAITCIRKSMWELQDDGRWRRREDLELGEQQEQEKDEDKLADSGKLDTADCHRSVRDHVRELHERLGIIHTHHGRADQRIRNRVARAERCIEKLWDRVNSQQSRVTKLEERQVEAAEITKGLVHDMMYVVAAIKDIGAAVKVVISSGSTERQHDGIEAAIENIAQRGAN